MHCVYVLQHTTKGERYIGCTNDLKRRIAEHNAGHQTATRRISGEWILIYAEIFRARSDAERRERCLKNNARGRQELWKRITASEISWTPKSGVRRS
ncbi:GIY-YIG nuclease family protein [Candidatus Kaiserbacteria bacterium]|nr:GIY-YIG nuclease family protein [Candidatus Kaiserbacteria bacterium]